MVAPKDRQWLAFNPGYLLVPSAAIMVLALFLPWAVVVAPPLSPYAGAEFLIPMPRTTLNGWQLHGAFLAVTAMGVAICGAIYLRGQAGLRIKRLLIACSLLSALIAALDLGDVMGRLAAVRSAFGPNLTEGSGLGIGVLIEGLAIVVLTLATLRAVYWVPGSIEASASGSRLITLLWQGLRRGSIS